MANRKFYIIALISLLISFAANSQIISPVKWNIHLDKKSATEGVIVFDAEIDEGWHLYSIDLPEGGPIPTSVHWDKLDNVKLVGDLTMGKAPHEEIDMVYHLKLGWWTDNAQIYQKVHFSDPENYEISGYVRYMVCNDGTCQSPKNDEFHFLPEKSEIAEKDSAVDTVAFSPTINPGKPATESDVDYWKPVTTNNSQFSVESHSFWYIFIGGFIGGLLALLTPCVWPMIPLTVSFFLKRHSSRRRAIIDAFIYGVSIIVIYLVIGIAITLIFNPSKLNELATDAIFNIIFFLLLIVFAMSFFGAFDIALPSKWTNKMDTTAERTTGLISLFFMAFTLILVSFSCTGPIIGTLLVEAVSLGDLTGPAIGMGAFALALAIPFTIFAIFPFWLKSLPKSGGWLNSVKIVLGFIELALSLKFLSVADLAYGWRILDREVFISLWVVIFALLGFYLLGKLRFSHDSKCESVGVTRFFLALISLAFSIYLLPGLWGAPLRSVSAFVPPMSTQDFNLFDTEKVKEFDNYDEGMDAALNAQKAVFLEFSGYGCVNCRKMEAAVLDKDRIRNYIGDNFITIKLMVDDKTDLEKVIEVEENGKTQKLRTYGDLWSYLQRYKFGANTQPYYVVLDNNGNLLEGPVSYDHNESVDDFYKFLESGLKKYNSSNE